MNEKFIIYAEWGLIGLALLTLSPFIIIFGLLFIIIASIRTVIIEITQEYRCKRCGTWIPKEKRDPDALNHWCSSDCYNDK